MSKKKVAQPIVEEKFVKADDEQDMNRLHLSVLQKIILSLFFIFTSKNKKNGENEIINIPGLSDFVLNQIKTDSIYKNGGLVSDDFDTLTQKGVKLVFAGSSLGVNFEKLVDGLRFSGKIALLNTIIDSMEDYMTQKNEDGSHKLDDQGCQIATYINYIGRNGQPSTFYQDFESLINRFYALLGEKPQKPQ